jgi:hypothetical protein
VLAAGCQSGASGPQPLKLSCGQSIDQWCSHDPLCVRKIDPTTMVADSYCTQVNADVAFGLFECPPGFINIQTHPNLGIRMDHLYSQATGDLIVVIEDRVPDAPRRCLAGPPTFLLEAVDCIGATIGNACVKTDASSE